MKLLKLVPDNTNIKFLKLARAVLRGQPAADHRQLGAVRSTASISASISPAVRKCA
jgi:hypothetical protein